MTAHQRHAHAAAWSATPGAAAGRPRRALKPVALLASMLAFVAEPAPAWAQVAAPPPAADAVRPYAIAAGELGGALARFGAQAGITLAVDATLVQGRQSPGVTGSYTVPAGLRVLLQGSGLQAVRQANGSYALHPAPASLPAGSAATLTTLPDVVVTGSTSPAGQAALPAYAGGQIATGARLGMLGKQDFMDTPFSTVSYTQAFIQDSNARDVAAVVGKTDASVQFSGGNNMQTLGTSNILNIRGFGVDATVIAFDGIFGVSRFNRGLLDLAERIEVIKGPSALTQGMPPGGAVGGSINLVPKRAGAEPLNRVGASYESDSTVGVQADVARRYGQGQPFGIRINAVRRDGGTEIRDQTKRDTLLAVGMDWQGTRSRVTADLYHSRFHQRGVDYGIALGTLTEVPAPPDPRRLFVGDDTFMKTEETALVLRGELDVTDNVSLHAVLSPSRSEYDALTSPSLVMRNLAGDATANLAHQRGIYRKFTGEVGVTAQGRMLGMGHRLMASVNQHRDRRSVGFRRNILGAGVLTNIYDPVPIDDLDDSYSHAFLPRSQDFTLRSVAVADTLSLVDERLLLTLGVRHQTVKSDTYDTTTGGVAARYDESAWSPGVAALWKLDARTSVYANYIEGLSQGATAPLTAANAGEVFPPYKSRQYETGVKFDAGTFASHLAVFQIKRPSSMTDPVTNVYSFGGEQTNRGLELGFFGEPLTGLRLTGGIAYTQARLTRTQGGVNQGMDAIASPRWQGKLGVAWDTPFLAGLTLTANATASSRQFVNAGNTLHIGGRTLYDLGMKYESRIASLPATVRLSVLNVTDKRYWASGLLYDGTGSPRTFVLSTTLDF